MSISLITAVRNRVNTIEATIHSIRRQSYENIEHVIVDGNSDDGTQSLINELKGGDGRSYVVISEPDNGVYDAINKGIRLCTSDVIGLLHSDDVYAEPNTIELIMKHFQDNPDIDVIFGDLIIFDSTLTKPLRYWKAGKYKSGLLEKGWMPPHPTLFARRRVFEQYGLYDTSYKVSADYDFILRIFKSGELKSEYIPQVLIHMRGGGLSSVNYWSIINEDYRAVKKNDMGGFGTLFCKYLRSAIQLFRKYRQVA